MFIDKVDVKIKKDKNFAQYIMIIRKYDNSLSMSQIKSAMENNEVVFSFDPSNNPIIHNGKDNSDCFLEEIFIKTLRLLKKAGADMIVTEGNDEHLEFSKISSSKMNVDTLIEKLFAAKDIDEVFAAIDKLKKIAKKDENKRTIIVEALMKYSLETSWLHLKSLIVIDINEIVKENDKQYADFYRLKIESGDFSAAYNAIEGYSKVMQREAYEYLVDMLFSDKLDMECKALIVCELSRLSNQPFDQGSPYEKREWKISDLRLNEIDKWRKDGFPDGKGYVEPLVHGCLKNPKTSAEIVYAKLNDNLAVKREKNNDKAHPAYWLTQANYDDMETIKITLMLPDNYLDFLEKASPLNVEIKLKGYGLIRLYGAHELVDCQEGYSYNPVKKEKIDGWPENYIVIADCNSDPFCIDGSKNNSPIYFAMHGMESWEFEEVYPSLIDFLKALK